MVMIHHHSSSANNNNNNIQGAIIDIKNNVDLTPEQLSAISNISPKNIRGSFFKSKMASIFQGIIISFDYIMAIIHKIIIYY